MEQQSSALRRALFRRIRPVAIRTAPRRPKPLPRYAVAWYPQYPMAPVPMCFTPWALRQMLATVGSRPPETGAKAWGPKDFMGIQLVEFDVIGSAEAGGGMYKPHVAWGEARQQHYLDTQPLRLWTGDIHSHPGHAGLPSLKCGRGLGDLGYVEEVFDQNESMQWFFIPILTGAGTGLVVIHPWVCQRANPVRLMTAQVKVCPACGFPEREFNPVWVQSLSSDQPGGDGQIAPQPPGQGPKAADDQQARCPARARAHGFAYVELNMARLSSLLHGTRVTLARSTPEFEFQVWFPRGMVTVVLPRFSPLEPVHAVVKRRGVPVAGEMIPWTKSEAQGLEPRLAALLARVVETPGTAEQRYR